MSTFGLITEGVTDQIVIDNILTGYFNNPDIKINPLLPLRDETDKHRLENYSNWQLVFEYCQSSKFKQALQFNDYIIIQIDTDTSEEKGYDIPKLVAGRELKPVELIELVIDKFKTLIGNFYHQNQSRIIFAISVHSIECWLLPLYYTNKHKEKTKNCLGTLNQVLKKREGFTINSSDKKPKDYEEISYPYCKHRTLMKLYPANPSLNYFIQTLEEKDFETNTLP